MLLVRINCKNFEEAQQISQILVKEKLVACANILPNLTSIYSWKGNIERQNESLIVVKTIKENLKKVEKRVKELHSYETPAIIAFQAKSLNKDYDKWIKDCCKTKK